MRSRFAATADELIHGDREQTYDDPNRNFRKIAQVWSALVPYNFDAADVALMMTALKLVREGHKHQDDNIIDAHGYLMCLERILDDKEANDSRKRPIVQLGKHPDADRRDALDMG